MKLLPAGRHRDGRSGGRAGARARCALLPYARAGVLILGLTASSSARAQTVREDFYITNGTVNAEVLAGDTLYIGGSFTTVGPVTGSGVPLDETTGLAETGFPHVSGDLNAVVADGAGGWFIGGSFTAVGGIARANLAHVLADHSVATWDPGTNGIVRCLLLSGTTLYAGGEFTSAGGQARNRIAALDATTGAASAWNPDANSTVRALAQSGSLVYAGGAFTSIGGQLRNRIAALDDGTGLASAWNPNANSTVFAIVPKGGTVYVAGQFTAIGGGPRNRLGEVGAATGIATGWNPNANATVSAMILHGSTVYVGGSFTTVGGQSRGRIAELDGSSGLATSWNPNANNQVLALALDGATVYAGGDFLTVGGAARSRIAALDASSGAATGWNPSAFGTVNALATAPPGVVYAAGAFDGMGGVMRNNLAAFDVVSGNATPWNPNANDQVQALAVDGGTVYAGGNFTLVAGQARSNLAGLDRATGLPTAWNPGADGEVASLAIQGSTIYVGGAFSNAGGAGRSSLAEIDLVTGAATSWNPGANGEVFALAPSAGVVYAGGLFSSAGGQTRNSIAALSAATGLATSWNPNANGTVRAFQVSCGKVYVAGFFTTIGGQTRNRLATLDATSGLAGSWNPNASGPVFALSLRGGRAYVGGIFTSVGGQARDRVAALDPASGLATAWNPGSAGTVRTIEVGGGMVYAGGGFNRYGGLQLANLAAATADAFTCAAFSIAPDDVPVGVVAVPYSQALTANGGTTPYCYAVSSGALPAGLTLASGSGVISGTPSTPGTSVFTVTATDANGCTGSAGYVMGVFATAPGSLVAANTAGLCISPAHPCVSVPMLFTRNEALPARGISVTFQLDPTRLALCTPGTPLYSIHAGPWASGYNATFQVVDHGGGSYTVDQAILGTPCGITVGGELFRVDVASAGADGQWPITVTSVKARDCDGAVLPAIPGTPESLTVLNTPIPISPPTLPPGAAANAYSQALTAGAGLAPFVWAVTLGTLPPGLTLSPAGLLSGTPTALGISNFTVGVTDANDCVGSRAYSLEIDCGTLAVGPAGLDAGVVSVPYADTLTVSGGIGPFTWALTSGTLPDGLSLAAATGIIDGTPTTPGNSVFTVSVTDSNGCTGSGGFVLSVFTTPPGSTVMANTAGLCLSPGSSCVSVPVVYTRDESAPARGISVTLQIETAKLALCGTPAASIHAGSWLSGFGNVSFQVVDHGGGSYTVDQALLGTPCGVTTGGELFLIDLVAADGDGQGAITVTAVSARDCDGAVLPAVPGPASSLAITSVSPTAITDLAAAQVLAGNGNGGRTGITITWATGGSGTVALYRAPFGTYPEYDDLGPTSPPDSSLAPAAPWVLATASATSGYVDHPPLRGFWYYVARITDACGNTSTVSNRTAGALDYHLGDVSDGVTPGQGDNRVQGIDLSLLGRNYGIHEPTITNRGVAYLDVGPTTDGLRTSRPVTDDLIDFEDLMVFEGNYDQGPSLNSAARPARTAAARTVSAAPEEFRVTGPSLVEAGETVTAELWVKGAGRLQGFSAHLAWDATVLTPLGDETNGMESAQWVEGQGGVVLTPGPGVVDAALLGTRDVGLAGEGRVARVRFRALRTGASGIGLESVDARDARNQRLGEGAVVLRAEATAPDRTLLLAPRPNPVRDAERSLLDFSLAERGLVELAIYGVDGRRVRTVVRGEREAGVYHEGWDGRDEGGHRVGSGVYYARLTAGPARFTQVVLRIR
jgi:hypothetical protein